MEATPDRSVPEATGPGGPLHFWRAALPGGFGRAGLQLILAWIAFDALSGTAWALHLKGLAKWSALPNYWGEMLTARDIWELLKNGGLSEDPLGLWAPLVGSLAMLWVFWAGWRVQAGAVGLSARLAPWLAGFIETLVLGLPILILGYGVSWLLEGIAGTGLRGLGWLNTVGGTLFKLACVSMFMVQWWLCRLDRAGHSRGGSWFLGSPERLLAHLSASFGRIWSHPAHWGPLILAGVLARVGLHFLVFLFAWKIGGGSSFRVWIFLTLQVCVAAVNAWLLGWFLRLTALFWRADTLARNGSHPFDPDRETEAGQRRIA